MKKLMLFIILIANIANANELEETITFTKDIKTIFATNCTTCHPGLVNYKVAYAKKDKILQKITGKFDKQMPPSYVSSKLSKSEVELIKTWITTGAKN